MALAAPSIDNAKVQHFSCASKFQTSIWGDFKHEFDEFERTVARACLACYRKNFETSNPYFSAILYYFSSISGNNQRLAALMTE